ncbi:MAG: 5'-nucleotidase C-terminal domain-containing protein [Bacteroidales bacterium]|jgi:2',3'-cyclic-nucleotide 2'-phosphodiesterase (5'-nucleotidase family)|nr:5'-nucleotidase C-terminal domain-containing protein [Bacteroidales bacterium]
MKDGKIRCFFKGLLFLSAFYQASVGIAYAQVSECALLKPAGSSVKVAWKFHLLDSSYISKHPDSLKAVVALAKYKTVVDTLMKPLGDVPRELKKMEPECPLSDMLADVIKGSVEKKTGRKTDMAITGFAQIRSALPAGKLSRYDIMTAFPFVNNLVVIKIKGKHILESARIAAAEDKVEIYSGCRIFIRGRRVKKMLVNGKRLRRNRFYEVATVDFITSGFAGEMFHPLTRFSYIENSGITIQAALEEYVKRLTAKGMSVSPAADGRVVVKDLPANKESDGI